MKDLERAGLVTRISGQGPPVLDEAEYATVSETKKFINESELVQWFTPILKEMVSNASARTGYSLALVNSERHAWVEDPHLGAASKPDMIVVHSALYTAMSSDADLDYSGADYVFGQLSNFDLCDSISVILEWKVDFGVRDFKAFGQGLEYVRRIVSTNPTSTTSDERSLQRIMIANKRGFALSTTSRGVPVSYLHGEWNSPGSRDAIVAFFSMQREWLVAMEAACQQLRVSFVIPEVANTSCFLGRGAGGRVFHVTRTGGGAQPGLAMKVSLGRDTTTKLQAELEKFNAITKLSERDCDLASCVTQLVDKYVESTSLFGALLMQPVGQPIGPPFTMYKILGALQALRTLGKRGIFHGDARCPNVLWVGDGRSGRAVWTDFQLSFITPGVCMTEELFAKDVETLLTSLNVKSDRVVPAATSFYNAEGRDLNSLMGLRELFQPVWQKYESAEKSATS